MTIKKTFQCKIERNKKKYYLLLGLGVDGGVDGLELFNSAHAEKTDETSQKMGGFWLVLFGLFDLLNDVAELFHLSFSWVFFEWKSFSLVSILEEFFDQLLPASGVDDVFLLSINLEKSKIGKQLVKKNVG